MKNPGAVAFPRNIHFIKSEEYWRERRKRFNQLIRHESCHLRQKTQEGSLRHYLKYFYYHLKYGHTNNPYEIEAREHELKEY